MVKWVTPVKRSGQPASSAVKREGKGAMGSSSSGMGVCHFDTLPSFLILLPPHPHDTVVETDLFSSQNWSVLLGNHQHHISSTSPLEYDTENFLTSDTSLKTHTFHAQLHNLFVPHIHSTNTIIADAIVQDYHATTHKVLHFINITSSSYSRNHRQLSRKAVSRTHHDGLLRGLLPVL